MGNVLADVDDELRGARDAVAEGVRVGSKLAALTADLGAAENAVLAGTTALDAERRDVARYEGGLWAFLYDVFADREGRLTKEQKEAAAAEIKLAEMTAYRDRLRAEVASLQERAAALKGAQTRLEAARVRKEAALAQVGDPRSAALTQLAEEWIEVEATHRELREAVAAGERASDALVKVAEALKTARGWGTADMVTDSLIVSAVKRSKMDLARTLAGTAQAEVTVFARELSDVGLALHTEVSALAGRSRFLDMWFDNIFTDWTVQNGIQRAEKTTADAIRQVDACLTDLRVKLADATQRKTEISQRRLELIES